MLAQLCGLPNDPILTLLHLSENSFLHLLPFNASAFHTTCWGKKYRAVEWLKFFRVSRGPLREPPFRSTSSLHYCGVLSTPSKLCIPFSKLPLERYYLLLRIFISSRSLSYATDRKLTEVPRVRLEVVHPGALATDFISVAARCVAISRYPFVSSVFLWPHSCDPPRTVLPPSSGHRQVSGFRVFYWLFHQGVLFPYDPCHAVTPN